MTVILEERDVQRLLDRSKSVAVIERAYRSAASGAADVSHPAALSLRGGKASGTVFKLKAAVLDDFGVAGLRIVGDVADPPGGGHSYIYLADAVTTAPLGLVAEVALHRVRTAVTGLVACRALRPAQATAVALVGTGRIAEEVVRCIEFALPDLPIIVASRTASRAQEAARRWAPLTPNAISAAPSIKDALARAGIVITITDAEETLFTAADLKPDALLCAMGGEHEFERDVLDAARSFIVDEIDFVCTAGSGAHWIKSGQIARPALEARVEATIGEVLLGRKAAPADGLTLAIIQGMAVCDLALAKFVLDRAAVEKE
jgi:ornithine cyclodeaminase/alanine dehydrogenase-like protein (mu-crystallin family)